MGPLDRVTAIASLVRALSEARTGADEVPDRAAMLDVQRAAARAGGIARMVAEIMPSYTGEHLRAPRPAAGSGAPEHRTVADPTARRSTVERLLVGAELAATRTALQVATTAGTGAIRTAMRALEQLASDAIGTPTRQQRAAHGREMADAWSAAVESPGAVEVSADGSVDWVGADLDGAGLATAVLRLQHEHGITHGRLGASTLRHDDRLVVAHWHRARSLRGPTLEFLRSFLDELAQDRGPAGRDLLDAGTAVGIHPEQVSHAVPVLREAIPTAVRVWRTSDLRDRRPRRHAAMSAPDPLAVVYALADLVAVETLTSPS